MIFSNPTQYAIRALSELVLKLEGTASDHRRRGNYAMLERLVADASLPRVFLAKIFRQLVVAGVLRSIKGPGGGYALARPANQITLLDVMEAVDGRRGADGCVVGLGNCNNATLCPLHDLFEPARDWLRSYLSTTTLADAAAGLRTKRTARVTRPSKRIQVRRDSRAREKS